MKSFVIQHKKRLLIATAVILLVTIITALYFSHRIHSQPGSEPVPEGRVHDAGVFSDDVVIHDSTEGEVVIDVASDIDSPQITPLSASTTHLVSDPNAIWTEDTYAGNHTPVEKAKMENGSIGVLTIDRLKLSVNVFESTDAMEDMKKGIAHFPNTSAFDGLVGLSAHNINFDGSDGYFKNLYTLKEGDTIHYKTALGERTYVVSGNTTIAASDWSPLHYQDSNQLALITCISGQPAKRLCVKAVEQK